MTLSQIRNRVHALRRRFGLPITVIRLRPYATLFCDQWAIARDRKQPPPDSLLLHLEAGRLRLPPHHLHEPPPPPLKAPRRQHLSPPHRHRYSPPSRPISPPHHRRRPPLGPARRRAPTPTHSSASARPSDPPSRQRQHDQGTAPQLTPKGRQLRIELRQVTGKYRKVPPRPSWGSPTSRLEVVARPFL